MIFGIVLALFCHIGDLSENYCLKGKDDYQSKLAQLKSLEKQNPQDLEVRLQIAELYCKHQMFLQAKCELLYVLSKKPNSPQAKELANKIFKNEQASSGKLYSSDKSVVLKMASSYFLNQQMSDAINTYKHLLSLSPSFKAYQELGEIYISVGNIKEALLCYQEAYKLKHSLQLKKKIAELLTWSKRYDEAVAILFSLHEKDPKDAEVALLIAKVFISRNNLPKALDILEDQLKNDPENVTLLTEKADVLAYEGHVSKSKKIYEKLLKEDKSSKMLSRYAATAQIWGDFSSAEKIYNLNFLEEPLSDFGLAKLLAATGRYYEAESIYRTLQLSKKTYIDATIGLAEVKVLEKNYEQALLEICALLKEYPYVEKAKLLNADILYRSKRYGEAKKAYLELIGEKIEPENTNLGLGKIFFKENNFQKAKIYLKKSLNADPNLEAFFYLWQAEELSLKTQVDIIERDFSCSAISKFAGLYLINDHPEISLELLTRLLSKDKECFPASLELIQTYEYLHDYDNAIRVIDSLLQKDPKNFKMLLWKARVLGWDKHYKRSLEQYYELEQISPNNSLLIREMARVAMWDKDFNLAVNTYDKILRPSVDQLLQTSLLRVLNEQDGAFYEEVKNLKFAIFQGYEKLWRIFFNKDAKLSRIKKKKTQKIFLEFFGTYKNQKAFYMEKKAKTLIWNKRHAQALGAYKNLINFEKDNEEAYFDLGQDQCELGLCKHAQATFKQLINIDPLHDRAHIALQREEIKSHSELLLSGAFWMEKGRGDLDQIMRNRIDSGAIFKINCENKLSFIENHYFEKPFFNHKNYNADGFTISYSAITSPFLRADFGFAKKYYWSSFKKTTQGLANLFFNINDFIHLQLGYLKKDHLENLFCLEQRTQEANYKIGAGSFINHKLDFLLEGTYVKFNDGNQGQYYFGDIAYRFTEHPSILKLKLVGEYRNLQKQNIYVFEGTNLVNIIFPYWTPDHYKAGKIVLDWYYDFSKYFFCASELHYLELKGSYGYDTEKNPAFEVDGEWHIEFSDHYALSITGLIYRSKIWNASGAWLNFSYRF